MIGECSIPILEAALAGRLPTDDEARLTQHLGECEACALAMERLVGEPEWRDAATLLKIDELDDALSGLAAGGDWSEVDFTVEHLEPADEPGTLGRLGGYDVLEIIGRGGMGVVLKAFDRELKRCVAIKVLAPHLANSALAKKRFAREARAAAAVVHPHVLAIHQVRASGTLPFLVMPLVSGESLAQRLARQGSLELREVLRIGMQAAAGLSAAHDQGLVHRDVKPANILLETGVERAVLTDFGLARAADDAAMTRHGAIAGTPQYMSPEQAKGEPLDGRSDLFSLGCVLFEMATGVSPFRADSALATMRRLVEEPPPALASLNPELPPWFIAIVQRLLEKDPANRFGSAREVSELLEGCLAHLQHPAAAPLPAALAKPVVAPAPRRRSYRTLGGIAMIATVGLVLCGAMAMFASDPPDIAGAWTGDDWGKVVLKKTGDGEYAGTYTDTFGNGPGEIHLKWSRIERRFNGAWREGDDRFGDLSIRLVDGEIRGANTTDAKSRINPATPKLADLAWRRDASPALQTPGKTGVGGAIEPPPSGAGDKVPFTVKPTPLSKTAWPLLRRFGAGGGVSALAGSPDGRVLAVGVEGRTPAVNLFDVEPGRTRNMIYTGDNAKLASPRQDPLQPTVNPTSALAFSPDGKWIALGTTLGQVKLVDAILGLQSRTKTLDDVDRQPRGDKTLPKFFEQHLAHGSVRSLAFSPDGSMLATCGTAIDYERDPIERGGLRIVSEGLLKTWDVKTGQRLIDFKGVYRNDVFDVAFSPDGSELASAGNGASSAGIHFWEPLTGKLKRSIALQGGPGTSDIPTCLAYSPDGKRLAVGFTRFDKTKDASTGMFAVVYPGSGILDWKQTSPSPIAKIAFTPDGTGVATAASNQGVLKIWDASTGTERSEIRIGDSADRARLTSFVFMPKAGILAVGGNRANGGGFVELRSLKPIPATATSADSGPPKVWAVAKYPPADGPWWTPEGKVLSMRPNDPHDLELRSLPDPKLAWYVVLVRVPGGFDPLINGDAIRVVGWPWFSLGRQFLSRQGDDAVALAVGLPTADASVDFTVEAAVGPWRSISVMHGQGVGKKNEGNKSGAQWSVTEIRGRLRFGVELPRADAQWRIAVKNDGNVTFTPILAPDAQQGPMTRIEAEIPGPIDLKGNVSFVLQSRRYEKIHLGKVALRPESAGGKGPTRITIPSDLAFPVPVIPKADASILRKINVIGGVSALAASPDGKVLAVGAHGGADSVFLLDVEAGRIRKLNSAGDNERAILAALKKDPNESTENEVSALAFSPDGKLLAIGTSLGQVKLYDAISADLLRTLDDVERKTVGDKKLPKFLELHLAHGSVHSLAFAPDGKTLATCGSQIEYDRDPIERGGLEGATEGLLKTWDVKTGERLLDFKNVNGNHVFDVAFSPDGSGLACVNNGGATGWIQLFDPHSGKLKRSIFSLLGQDVRGRTTCLAYAPDGKRLAVGFTRFSKDKSASGMFAVIYPESGIVDFNQTSPFAVSKIAFTPDGTDVATLADNTNSLKFWNASNGVERSEIRLGEPGEPVRTTCFVFLPKTRILALGGINGGRVELRSLDPAVAPAVAPAAPPKVKASDEPRLRVLQAELLKLEQQLEDVKRILIPGHPDIQKTEAQVEALRKRIDEIAPADVPAKSPESTNPAKRRSRIDFGSDVRALALSPDGRQIALESESRPGSPERANPFYLQPMFVRIKDELPAFGSGPSWSITRRTFEKGDRKAMLAPDSKEKNQPAMLPRGSAFAFSPDGAVLAVGSNLGQVMLFDAKNLELLRAFDDVDRQPADGAKLPSFLQLRLAHGYVRSTAFSPDGSLLATSGTPIDRKAEPQGVDNGKPSDDDGVVKIWDVKTGERLFEIRCTGSEIAFSPDGGQLAVASTKCGVDLWDTKTGKLLRNLSYSKQRGASGSLSTLGSATCLAFSPDGKRLAVGMEPRNQIIHTNHRIVVADTTSGVVDPGTLRTYSGRPIASMMFAPDGETIVTIAADGAIAFQNPMDGEASYSGAFQPKGPGQRWRCFAFAAKGRILALGGNDGNGAGIVETWDLDPTPTKR